MLTRLHVRGFKSLHDVEIEFGPFTCVAGPNGVGKSNLFDAVRFLHLLATRSIAEAVNDLRATGGRSPDPAALFTALGGGERAAEMRFTADLLMPRRVRDQFDVDAEASVAAVRYEVAFRLDDGGRGGRLELVDESLVPRSKEEVRDDAPPTYERVFLDSVLSGQRQIRRPLVFKEERSDQGAVILAAQEGHSGRPTPVPAAKASRTVLAGLATGEFPTILATHREFESWRTLMLEPSAMRCPSGYRGSPVIDSRGGNLPAAIKRLERSEDRPGRVRAELVDRLAGLIDDIRELRVRDHPPTETYTVEAGNAAGAWYPADALSDGTLRLLVLATIEQDPTFGGLLCLEEPENGIHPERMPNIVRLLRAIAVDPEEPVAEDNPLRQVLVNTHSPPLFAAVDRVDTVVLRTARLGPHGAAVTNAVPGHRRPDHGGRNGTTSRTFPSGLVRPYYGEAEYQRLLNGLARGRRNRWVSSFTRCSQTGGVTAACCRSSIPSSVTCSPVGKWSPSSSTARTTDTRGSYSPRASPERLGNFPAISWWFTATRKKSTPTTGSARS